MDDIHYSDTDPASGEHKTVMMVYGLLWLLLVFSLLPGTACFLLGLLMFTVVPMTAARIRRKAAPDSLSANHMTWIVRTVGIAAALALTMAIIAACYMMTYVDFTTLQGCVSDIMDKTDAMADAQAQLLSAPCLDNFIAANAHTFGAGSLIAEAPFAVYLLWRLAKGIIRAHKDERIINVTRWL